jgi:hypothetical protein
MLSASTRNSGQNVASPDVCNTPTGTGVDAPIPYVNTATHSQAVAFATTVMIEGGNALTMASSIPSTSGDESGDVAPRNPAGGALLERQPVRVHRADARHYAVVHLERATR